MKPKRRGKRKRRFKHFWKNRLKNDSKNDKEFDWKMILKTTKNIKATNNPNMKWNTQKTCTSYCTQRGVKSLTYTHATSRIQNRKGRTSHFGMPPVSKIFFCSIIHTWHHKDNKQRQTNNNTIKREIDKKKQQATNKHTNTHKQADRETNKQYTVNWRGGGILPGIYQVCRFMAFFEWDDTFGLSSTTAVCTHKKGHHPEKKGDLKRL